MSETLCKVCDVQCTNEYDFEQHIRGKKHAKNVADAEKLLSISKRSIFVSKLPPDHVNVDIGQKLIHFFSQFDNIISYSFGFRSMIVEFQNCHTVDFLLSKPIYYENRKLNIARRIIKSDKTKVNKNTEKKSTNSINNTNELDYKKISHVFTKDVSFDEQLTEFLSIISIEPDEIETRYESTRLNLENIFKVSLPNCKVHRFGSTINGLGLKNCDLDVYLDSVANKPNAPTGLRTSASIFSDVKRILYSKSHIFSNVVPIPQAKTPIIKFIFKPTNVAVDLSFKNNLAVYNSKLIKHLLSTDDRLRPTMMILKYWVCNYELHKGNKMSKYSLTLLFIFYCQQPSVRLLPPILELKEKVKPEIVEGWQVNFKEEKINRSTSNPSIPELLIGFFEFYANYNFQLNVVCPIDGMSHKKIMLNSIETLPDSMKLYKEYLKTREQALVFPLTKPMCVQDPNELNHNVTGSVNAQYLDVFQKYCGEAAALCKSTVTNNYKSLLATLFELKIAIAKKPSPIVSFIFYANNLLEVGLPDDFDKCTNIEDKDLFIREHWIDMVIDLTQIFLKKVLKLQVQVINEKELKQQKVDLMSDVHTNNSKVDMHCTGDTCLWRDRKGCGKSFDPSLSMLEKEASITDTIYQVLTSKNRAHRENINFICEISKKPVKNPYILVKLKNRDTDKVVFNELAFYIQHKLVVILEKTLLHMKQYKKKLSDINLTV